MIRIARQSCVYAICTKNIWAHITPILIDNVQIQKLVLVSLTESIPDPSWKTEQPCGGLYLRRLKRGGKSHQIIPFFKQTVYNEVGKKGLY